MKFDVKSKGLALFFGLSLAAQGSLAPNTSINQSETSHEAAVGPNIVLSGGGSFWTLKSIVKGQSQTYSYTVSLAAGQTFNGLAAFDNRSEDPTAVISSLFLSNDSAEVRVSSSTGVDFTDPWKMNSYTAWNRNRSSAVGLACPPIMWEAWHFTAPTDDLYSFEYIITKDSKTVTSQPKFNSFAMFAAVPEPSTWASGVVLSVVMVVSFAKNRRKTVPLA